jgi:uncharacterized repeat protein (TIGR01451 family)
MKKILVIASMMLLGSSGAWALGTAAGTTVSNSASLTYSVAGATQPVVNTQTPDTFIVDKKIDFILTHEDAPKHVVTTPGATQVVRTFKLQNDGNKIQDFTFVATNLTGNEVYDGKTDNKDVTNFEYSIDGGTTWSTAAPTVDNLAVDGDVTILVRADIPNTNVNGDVMNIQLEATAVQDGTTTPEVNTGSVNGALDGGPDRKTTEDTVLGEGAGVTTTGNTQFDGKYSAWAGYIIEAPVLSLSKDSCVLTDNVTADAANAKRIPGATIIYMLDIENTGATAASDINITDQLPSGLEYTTVSNVKIETDKGAACTCANGTAANGTAGSNAGATPDVKINGITVSATNHTCVSFEVDISNN